MRKSPAHHARVPRRSEFDIDELSHPHALCAIPVRPLPLPRRDAAVSGFRPFVGQHCETVATGYLLGAAGIDLSEPMLFGFGEGLGFIFINLSSLPLPFVGGRAQTVRADDRACAKTSGSTCKAVETTSKPKAWSTLESAAARRPARWDCSSTASTWTIFRGPSTSPATSWPRMASTSNDVLLVDTAPQGTLQRASRSERRSGAVRQRPDGREGAEPGRFRRRRREPAPDASSQGGSRRASARTPARLSLAGLQGRVVSRDRQARRIAALAGSSMREGPRRMTSRSRRCSWRRPAPAARCSGISIATSWLEAREYLLGATPEARNAAHALVRRIGGEWGGRGRLDRIQRAARETQRRCATRRQRCRRVAEARSGGHALAGENLMDALIGRERTPADRFVASSPRGFGDLLARELRELRRRRRARARARRGIQRAARGGVPRLPRIARRQPRVPRRRAIQRGRPTRASTTPRVPSTGARTSILRARSPATSRANIPRSRTRASARCGSRTRSAISCAMPPAAGPTSRPTVRRARACARERPERHGVHRPVRRGPASPRLSRRRRAKRRCARTSPPESWCARAGRRNAKAAAEFLDPMCGSGTLVIEAAMIAAQRRARCAAALLRILRLGGARPRRLGSA